MTGTNVMNGRHVDLHNDYLGGAGIIKSKTSIGNTGSRHSEVKADKRHERSAKTSTGGLPNSAGNNNNNNNSSSSSSNNNNNNNKAGGSGGLKKSRHPRQRGHESQNASRTKPSKDDAATDTAAHPLLPPISSLQIINTFVTGKGCGSSSDNNKSPRLPIPENLSANNNNKNMPSFSLAPTRMAVRNAASSPDVNPDTSTNNQHTSQSQAEQQQQEQQQQLHSDGLSHARTTLPPSTPGKRHSLPSGHLLANGGGPSRLGTSHNNSSNNNSNNNSGSSPQPRSPRLVSENSRLSPINSLDKPKMKFEKKVIKSMMDNSWPSSPRAYKMASSELACQPIVGPARDGKTPTQRRPSVKSLPKLAPSEEHFSIRRKIEQFRKWHEEQHADNMKRLSSAEESPSDQIITNAKLMSNSRTGPLPSCSTEVLDFAKLLEDKIIENKVDDEEEGKSDDVDNKKENAGTNGASNDNCRVDEEETNETNNKVKKKHKSKPARPVSGATWKTWRDINESDAYTDVKKYIHDNDLMDPERESWIKSWLQDVSVAMSETGDISLEV